MRDNGSSSGKSAVILVTRGYAKKSGYYFRCQRDLQVLEATGYVTTIVNVSEIGLGRALWSRRIFGEYRKRLVSSDLVLLENYGALTFFWLDSLFRFGRQTKTVFVCHGSLEDLRSFRWYRLRRLVYSFAENRMAKALSAVACVSIVMMQDFERKYPRFEGKIVCTPNLPVPAFYREVERQSQKLRSKLRMELDLPNDKKLLIYVGNCQAWQNLGLLVSVCVAIQDESNEFYFVFLSQEIENLQNMLDRAGVRASGYSLLTVENQQVPGYLVAADFLYVVRDQSEVNRVACPTKAVEYLISGTPVVISAELGDVSKIVSESGRGIVVSRSTTENPRLLATEILNYSGTFGERSAPSIAPLSKVSIFGERHNYDVFAGILK